MSFIAGTLEASKDTWGAEQVGTVGSLGQASAG